jgi:hypothetical membrane protein
MNGSFVLQGILTAGGALLLLRKSRPLEQASAALLTLCGLGVLVVGLAPEDAHWFIHVLGAAAHFVAGGLGIFLMGAAQIREKRSMTGWISVATGLSILIATAVLGNRKPEFAGAIERVSAYCITLWLVVQGSKVLGQKFTRPALH